VVEYAGSRGMVYERILSWLDGIYGQDIVCWIIGFVRANCCLSRVNTRRAIDEGGNVFFRLGLWEFSCLNGLVLICWATVSSSRNAVYIHFSQLSS